MEETLNNNQATPERAYLVVVSLPDSDFAPQDAIAELTSLVEAAGAQVVGYARQNRRSIHPATYIGSGKAEQIAERLKQLDANLVVFDNDLSPAQTRELEKLLQCKVIDRSVVILDIFSSRARTHEARLQVELAQLQYTYPRLTRMWSHLDTVTAGASSVGAIGTRGPGEKQLEIDRRLVQKRLNALMKQIEEIDRRKQRQVKTREGHFTVSLVGYTNAGKSTLMNTLTDSGTYVKDQLFATLDTKTARWQLNQDHSALLSDTVGFVRHLPHHLVASFRATLEEAIHADLLLHVIDVSHPQVYQQIEAVNSVLQEIDCGDKETLLVLNKTDRPGTRTVVDTLQTLYPDALSISAKKGLGLPDLVDAVMVRLTGDRVHLRISCSLADGRIRNFICAYGDLISEQYSEQDVILEAYLGSRQLPELQRLQPDSYEVVSSTVL